MPTTFTSEKTNLALRLSAKKNAPEAVQKQLPIKCAPYQAHSNTYLHSTPKGKGYYRSSKHPIAKIKDTNPVNQRNKGHAKAALSHGGRAHFGYFHNNLTCLGDRSCNKKHPKASSTTPGDASLYDELLSARQAICAYMARKLSKLKHLKVSYYHEYPCLMILILPSSVVQTHQKASDASLNNWSHFLSCYLEGALNATAALNNIPIEIIDRSSFGFLSPTLAPTDDSIRLNTGIIPKAYQSIIIKTLTHLDATLGKLTKSLAESYPIPKDSFFLTDEFKNYRKNRRNKNIGNIVELLWEPVDTMNKTGIYNIMRSNFAHKGIAKSAFKSLLSDRDNHDNALMNAISWALDQLYITDQRKLTFNQSDNINYNIRFDTTHSIDITWYDKPFWDTIKSIHDKLATIEDKLPILETTLAMIKSAYNNGELNQLYAKLEAVQDALLIQAGMLAEDADLEDGYGSDSDEEDTTEETTVYSRKIITNNGMRAIIGALIAVSINKKELKLLLDRSYYEIQSALPLITSINGINVFQKKKLSEASVYLTDATPCITDGNASKIMDCLDEDGLDQFAGKIMIIDVTSATIETMRTYYQAFKRSRSPLLCLVSSGLKNEQLGSDNNAYGTIRLFSKSKTTVETAYARIRNNEEPVQSIISHLLRRIMKSVGATPTNACIMRGP